MGLFYFIFDLIYLAMEVLCSLIAFIIFAGSD